MTTPAVHLRPFTEDELWIFDRWVLEPGFSGEFEWLGFRSAAGFRQRFAESGLLGGERTDLVVADDDTPVGWMNWRVSPWLGPTSWEIGALVFPEHRGRGVGTEAHRLVVDELFANTPTERIWAGTEAENLAEQRVLERCGFVREGLMRRVHFRAGAWRDGCIYGLLRDDPRPGR